MADSAKRILYFGGTFNPIHNGHLLCAQAVAEWSGFERVILIPSAVPPHRSGQNDMAPAADRLTMCQLAVAGSELFGVSDVELRRDGPSFTVDTAKFLRNQGAATVHWLIGADTVPRLPTWHDYPLLMQAVEFVVVLRPGAEIDWNRLDSLIRPLRHNVARAPLIDISASDVRERVRTGREIRYHVPPAVADYIAKHRLYRAP